MNEILFFASILVYYSLLLICYKLFGKIGLFAWICIATIIANIEVLKLVDMLGFQATLGNVIYGTSFLATDILCEKFGKKDAGRAVYLGFFTTIVFILMMQVMLIFTPSSGDIFNDSLKQIFSFTPRIVIASILTFLFVQKIDIWAYMFVWSKTGDKHLWARNNISTLTSQLIDTFLFTFLAFYGVFPISFMELFLTTYFIKVIISVLDTPFMYIAKNIKPIINN
jgi:uncharacterized integral membrane protein (TIGR00697 family)